MAASNIRFSSSDALLVGSFNMGNVGPDKSRVLARTKATEWQGIKLGTSLSNPGSREELDEAECLVRKKCIEMARDFFMEKDMAGFDFFGIQEAPFDLEDSSLEKILSGTRFTILRKAGSQNAILFNSHRFNFIEGSAKTELDISDKRIENLPASAITGRFMDTRTKKIIEVATTHLTGYDLKNHEAHPEEAETGRKQLENTVKLLHNPYVSNLEPEGKISSFFSYFSHSKPQKNEMPEPNLTIFMGDLNALPGHASPRFLVQEGFISDETDARNTAFSGKIDHIFARSFTENLIEIKAIKLQGDGPGEHSLSDHDPCLVRINFFPKP